MNETKPLFGNESDGNARKCAYLNARQSPPSTLSDVLRLLDEIGSRKKLGMLRSAASRLCEFFNAPPDEIPIEALWNSISGFASHLRDRRKSQRAIWSYCSYVRRLIRIARQAGWGHSPTPLEKDWEAIVDALKGKRTGVLSLPRYAVEYGIAPAQLKDADLDRWAAERVKSGVKYSTAIHSKRVFRRTIREAGLESLVPLITLANIRAQYYGVPVALMPDALRSQVQALMEWKQKPYVVNRPRKARIRKPTARALESTICRVYGYTIAVLNRSDIQNLRDLIVPEILNGFVEWSFEERRVTGTELVAHLPVLFTAMRQYFSPEDFSWAKELMASLPIVVESERNERKDAKLVHYSILAEIPNKLEERRKALWLRNKKSISL